MPMAMHIRSIDALSTIALVALAIFAGFGGMAHAAGGAHAHQGTASPATPGQTPFGIAGKSARVSRTVAVDMTDEMRFIPAFIEVNTGETIRFRARNKGRTLHEMVIGRLADLQDHAVTMRTSSMSHDEPNVAHVKPGGTGEIVWTFNRPGEFGYACFVAGHFEAGMIGKVIVKATH